MSICNIVSKNSKLEGFLFNHLKTIDELNNDIPTIIIGWEYTKQLVGDKYKLSILEKKITDNLFWTFEKTEKRIDYEQDISNFIKYSLKQKDSNIKYQYINVLISKYKIIKKILKLLNSNFHLYIYIKNNSFIYILHNNTVYGLDFNMIDYLGIDRKKIYKRLYGKNNEIFFSDKFLNKEIRENISSAKIIPLLYKLNGGNNTGQNDNNSGVCEN